MRLWDGLQLEVPPTSAVGILNNTSLTPQPLPPWRPGPGQIAAMNRYDRLREQWLREEQARHHAAEEEAAETRRIREAMQRADEADDDLRAHYETLQPLQGVFTASLARFQQADPDGCADFLRHCENANKMSEIGVRRLDICCWYQNLPYYVRLALHDLQRYFHTQSQLRLVMSRYQRKLSGWHDKLNEVETRAADCAAAGMPSFGMEDDAELHIVHIGDFKVRDFDTDDDEVAFVRANFEARRVRLEQESDEDLRLSVASYEVFEDSLEHSVLMFCKNVLNHYYGKTVSNALANVLTRVSQYRDRLQGVWILALRLANFAGAQSARLDIERELSSAISHLQEENPYEDDGEEDLSE